MLLRQSSAIIVQLTLIVHQVHSGSVVRVLVVLAAQIVLEKRLEDERASCCVSKEMIHVARGAALLVSLLTGRNDLWRQEVRHARCRYHRSCELGLVHARGSYIELERVCLFV